jgi:hypothetical protein
LIYHDTGVALSQQGTKEPLARQFVDFLQANVGALIFAKWVGKSDCLRRSIVAGAIAPSAHTGRRWLAIKNGAFRSHECV